MKPTVDILPLARKNTAYLNKHPLSSHTAAFNTNIGRKDDQFGDLDEPVLPRFGSLNDQLMPVTFVRHDKHSLESNIPIMMINSH